MAHNVRNESKQAETSEQGSKRLMLLKFQSYMDNTDEKFGILQEQISQILRGMSGVLRTQEHEIEVFSDDSEPELNDGEVGTIPAKGVFRNPILAAFERQKTIPPVKKKNAELKTDNFGSGEEMSDTNSLKHLKLTFPSLK